MLSMLALLVSAQLSSVEEFTVVDGTLWVENDAAAIEGSFEVTTCGIRECQTDIVDGTFALDLGKDRMNQLGEGSVPVVGGWIEVGLDGRVSEAELDVDGGALDASLMEALPSISTEDTYGIMIYIIYVGDDDDDE
ncbi:MAG: hypothetical protein HN348_02955 [Proteobacteria bacterium]|jgi:hypothetical protein|nr:hypothetical protein [Pseudomonadota bacterium]